MVLSRLLINALSIACNMNLWCQFIHACTETQQVYDVAISSHNEHVWTTLLIVDIC